MGCGGRVSSWRVRQSCQSSEDRYRSCLHPVHPVQNAFLSARSDASGLHAAEVDRSGGCVYPDCESSQPMCVRFLSCSSAAVSAGGSKNLAAYQSGRMERIANPFAQALVGSNPTAAFRRVGRGLGGGGRGRGNRAGVERGVPISISLPFSGPLVLCVSHCLPAFPLPAFPASSPRPLPSPLCELCVLFTQARPRGNDRP